MCILLLYFNITKAENLNSSFQESSQDINTSSFCFYAKKILSNERIKKYDIKKRDVNIDKFFDMVLSTISNNDRLVVYSSFCNILHSLNIEDNIFFNDLKRAILFKENTTILNISKYSLTNRVRVVGDYEKDKNMFFLYMTMAYKHQDFSSYVSMYKTLSLLMLYTNSNSEIGNCILELLRNKIVFFDKNKLTDIDLMFIDLYLDIDNYTQKKNLRQYFPYHRSFSCTPISNLNQINFVVNYNCAPNIFDK